MPKEGNGTKDTGNGGNGNDQQFTQADVDRIVAQRIQREREKFADYDSLKGQLDELKATLQTSEATLQEKKEAIANFQAAESAWAEERALRDLKDRVLEEATKAGFRYPGDAYVHLDLAVATEDPSKVGDLVAALAKDRADLLGKQVPPTTPTQPSRSGQPGPGEETREQKLKRLGFRPGPGILDMEGEGGGLVLPPGWDEGVTQ